MDKPRPKSRRWTFLVFGVLFLLLGYTLFGSGGRDAKEVTYSQFMAEVDAGKVKKAVVNETRRSLEADLDGGAKISARYVGEENIAERLRGKGVDVDVKVDEGGGIAPVLLSLLPTLLFVVLIVLGIRWVMRQSGPGGQASLFSSNKAKRIDAKEVKTRFSDVLGADEAIEDARELVSFLKNPAQFARTGGKVPRGTLFVGPPGTGKTLLARAIAGEAGVPFLATSGSEFVELFVGVGAGRVRSLMEEARKGQPCIVFIDEIDAVGRKRGSGLGNGHDEREQTLNQLLVEMDGFSQDSGVLVIAATNRPDVLDEALLRRFGRTITLPHPDITGRLAILTHYASKVPLATGADLRAIAGLTAGFSGDHLEKLVNEAALMAARAERERVTQADLENAFEKIVLGAPRKLVMSAAEKRRTSVHEIGHTLIARKAKDGSEFHKVSILPRGRTLGVTLSLPTEDKLNLSESECKGRIKVLLAGRAAEIIVFKECSTGASDDLERATELAKDMVTRWGMSEKHGPVAFERGRGPMFLGRDLVEQRSTSEATAREFELTIMELLAGLHKEVMAELAAQHVELLKLAEALLIAETLTREEIEGLLAGN